MLEPRPQTVPAAKPQTGRVIGPGAGAAREAIAAYHRARLDELVQHVAAAVDGWQAGSRDAYDVDEVLRRYPRAARELWKFCWGTGGGHVEWVADQLRQLAESNKAIDWWERGAPRRRSNPTR
jgi:hypothetical protein